MDGVWSLGSSQRVSKIPWTWPYATFAWGGRLAVVKIAVPEACKSFEDGSGSFRGTEGGYSVVVPVRNGN